MGKVEKIEQDVQGLSPAELAEFRAWFLKEQLDWEYDKEADVLYVSIGKPKKAIGIDIGEGIVVRYDEPSDTVVGLTILGIRTRLQASLTKTEG